MINIITFIFGALSGFYIPMVISWLRKMSKGRSDYKTLDISIMRLDAEVQSLKAMMVEPNPDTQILNEKLEEVLNEDSAAT